MCKSKENSVLREIKSVYTGFYYAILYIHYITRSKDCKILKLQRACVQAVLQDELEVTRTLFVCLT